MEHHLHSYQKLSSFACLSNQLPKTERNFDIGNQEMHAAKMALE